MRRLLASLVLLVCTSLALYSEAGAANFVDLGTFGSPGAAPGRMSGPNGIAVGDDGSIYVADTYNLRVNKYTSSGAFVLSWGTSGFGNGQFQFPYGIDVNSAGEVFVGDLSRADVQVFSSTGAYLRRFGSGILTQPFGLSVDDAGSVYITDRPTSRVHKFTTAGAFVSTIGPGLGGQSFSQPQNVDCLGATRIIVSDGGTTRIQELSSAGAFVRSHGVGSLTNPTGTAVTGDRLIVTEYNSNRVSVINMSTGVVENTLGDDEPYTFNSPFDAAVIGDSILLILEAGNSRVRRLRIVDGQAPTVVVTSPANGLVFTIGDPVGIAWTASDDGSVVSIDLEISRNGGVSYTSIATGLPNSGSYSWTAEAPASASCKVRVIAHDDGGTTGSGSSPGLFRIGAPGPQVTVLSPNGGESFGVGSVVLISWSVVGESPAIVEIRLSRDGGATYQFIGSTGGGNTNFAWVSDGPPSANCRVKVTAITGLGGSGSDESDASFAVVAPPGFGWTFAGTFGSSGSGLGFLAGPDGIATTDDGRVYIADTYNSRVQWFDRVGNALGQFGGIGELGEMNMVRPYGIDVDAAGHVYVGDFATRLVKKFTAEGAYLGLIGDSASFAQPFGLWVSDEGTVYVTDRPARRVRLFSAATGAPTGEWGPTIGAATLQFPQNIEGDGCGMFFVSDGSGGFEIRTLDGGGQQVHSQPSPLGGNPTGSALAGSHLFLTEYDRNRLSVSSLVTHALLDVLGDDEPFSLNSPIDAATMGDSMLYVLDTGNNRVVRMRLPALTPPTVQVIQPNGGEVVFYPSPLLITWDATDDVEVVSVDLLISRDSGLSWSVIATELPNTGQYEWAVTGPASDHCLVRVIARDAAGGVGKDRSDLEFAIIGLPVPTLLVSLFAEDQPDGIAVQWQLADAQLQAVSRLQRSVARDGAYSMVEGEPSATSDGMRLVDRDIERGRTYWYRVVAGEQRFGPIAVESGAVVAELAFAPPRPNPSVGATRLAFALPRAAEIDLTILDVSGREVVRLVDGERPAGRHEITWSGEDERGRLVPGLYFARLAVQGEAARVQRVVLTR